MLGGYSPPALALVPAPLHDGRYGTKAIPLLFWLNAVNLILLLGGPQLKVTTNQSTKGKVGVESNEMYAIDHTVI